MLPQYRSNGFSDELGWAAAWLHTATAEERYARDFQANMRRGEDRWYYEGWAASWDDVNALAKLRKPHVALALRDYMTDDDL